MYFSAIVDPILTTTSAKPFLKWAGGKQQLLTKLDACLPTNFDRYFEPFVGGGALFFHLWTIKRLPSQVFLFDINDELINAYCTVRDNPEALANLLAIHQETHSNEHYYAIRDLDRQNRTLTDIEMAARTIYLNKTCYNGLFRVNSKRQFNVPMGSYKDPKILKRDALGTASSALQGVYIQVKDFRDMVALGQSGDFFYFDPPYDPVSKTASFTGYTANSFRDEDQQDLARIFRELSEKGCLCMLSNSHTPLILELYRDFRIEVVDARRSVNSNKDRRGTVREVVILNY
ncbi:MAG: DNA adenine methylase [Myxococcales bacterium]|nr:DNA adenine methylase [Myxococcales bacterium]